MALYINNKIQVRKSPIHGWGVFAKDKIYENEVLEECPFLILPINKGESSSLFIDYRFNYPQDKEWYHQVMVLGYGSLYNHSNQPNASWSTDEIRNVFVFKSTKDIEKNQEILVYYGGTDYWNDGRKITIR
jgi:SET domain-containing protein